MIKAVFPGTFDPIHYGHINIALRARKIFNHLIIAVYDKPLKDLLFSPEERISMAKVVFSPYDDIEVIGYSGLTVDFCTRIGAQVLVRGLRVFSDFEHEFRIALANQRLKPEIEMVSLITNEQHTFLSSSTVKEIASLNGDVSTMVPQNVETALKQKSAAKGDFSNQTPNSLKD
ncbi:MAG: pantetheine-phosphate adenylyltransferase [Anaerolineae bacterium]|nr:pantetheine-phosphate adenylyltransferase [Anaerolineae bacterium]